MGDKVSREKVGNGQLTDEDVSSIRTLYTQGSWTKRGLAARFGVSPGIISQIVRGERRGSASSNLGSYTARARLRLGS